MKKSYNLFLDDERHPHDVFWKEDIIYSNHEWVIVRNADTFREHIMVFGIPKMISFDNDIQDFTGLHDSEITGLMLAHELCNYCIDSNFKFPKVLSHSKNIIDQPKIEALFENASKHHPDLVNS